MSDGRRKGPPSIDVSRPSEEPRPTASALSSLRPPTTEPVSGLPISGNAIAPRARDLSPVVGDDKDDNGRESPSTPVIVGVSAAGALVVILGLFLVLRSPDGATNASEHLSPTTSVTEAEVLSPTTELAAAETQPTTTTSPPSTTAAVASAEPQVAAPEPVPIRDATLFADDANIRERPNLNANIVYTVIDRRGAPLTVFGAIQSGWYEVEIDGIQGWMFGAFVLPPDDGYSIGLNLEVENPVRVFDNNGDQMSKNPSGNKVLITSEGDDWHEILHPEGQQALARADEIRIVG